VPIILETLTMSRIFLRLALLLSVSVIAACNMANIGPSTTASSTASSHAELVRDARQALNNLYATTPRARELHASSYGILIFPGVMKAGLLVGGEGGNGVLFSKEGKVLGYYNVSALSYGFQAGAQNFSEAMFLMTPGAKRYLDSSDGWSIGSGPSVVVADTGMAVDLSTTTERSDVYAFVFGQSGLMAGLGVQGQKITRLTD
jgi:lipid-binding SYLF domain-containing protein